MPRRGRMMSANITAASTWKRRTGCSVTSAQRSGSATISTRRWVSRNLRYSGRERPACRIIQIGVRSTGRPRAASRKRLLARAGGIQRPRDLRLAVSRGEEPGLELRRGRQHAACAEAVEEGSELGGAGEEETQQRNDAVDAGLLDRRPGG